MAMACDLHCLHRLLLLSGKKRWLMAPPNNTLAQTLPTQVGSAVAMSYGFSWKVGGPIRTGEGVIECVQSPGDLIYLPSSWYHATRNEHARTIGIGGQGHSPGLHGPASRNDVQEAELLCESRGYLPSTCLNSAFGSTLNVKGRGLAHTAAAKDAVDFLKWLLDNDFKGFQQLDARGSSAVQLAAGAGRLAAVTFLHTRAGIPATKGFSKRGRKSIHTACSAGHLEVVEWLVDVAGVSVNEKDADGTGPIHLAVAGNHPHTIRWLLARGASPDSVGESNATPLMVARAVGNNPEVTRILQDAIESTSKDKRKGVGKSKGKKKSGRKRRKEL